MSVDKEQVRMLVADLGPTEAAKRSGIPRNTIYQWTYRYKWKQPPLHSQAVRTVRQTKQPPAQAHAQALAELSSATRFNFAKSAHKVSAHSVSMTPVQVIKVSRGLKNVTEIAEKVHGWNAQSRSTSVFANQAVVIDDATIDELQARLKRLRGES